VAIHRQADTGGQQQDGQAEHKSPLSGNTQNSQFYPL
jgi:hypothetical protein